MDDISGGLSQEIIGCAIKVHQTLGPGLLESAYRQCLAHELYTHGLSFKMEVPLPIRYGDVVIDCAYRMDVIVEDKVLLELKAVEGILPIHEAQLLTYLKLSGLKLGLLMNFNVQLMKHGIKRRAM